jgi:thioredoxin reductase
MANRQTQTLIIASGAGHRHLGLQSEELREKRSDVLAPRAMARCRCSRNQPLVVVGGGDSACEEATYLTRFGSTGLSRAPARHVARFEDHGAANAFEPEDQSRMGFDRDGCSLM